MSLCAIMLGALFTFVELNGENLFDCEHDEGKIDQEWMPESLRHWTRVRYWQKLNDIGKEIISCGEIKTVEGAQVTPADVTWKLPDMVALCEVENDSVMHDLTKRSLLRNAGYEYLMTQSPDLRGIDVALLYSPFTFRLLRSYPLRVTPRGEMRPTRDILYASGELVNGDTLHVFVLHAPSRYGGEKRTRPYRRIVAERLLQSVDSLRNISENPKIIVAGDFNDSADDEALKFLCGQHLHNVSRDAKGKNGAKGSYKYQGKWESIDHVLVSDALLPHHRESSIHDAPFLLEEDEKYGGVKPHRNYNGMHYQKGFSDHLPVVVRFSTDL